MNYAPTPPGTDRGGPFGAAGTRRDRRPPPQRGRQLAGTAPGMLAGPAPEAAGSKWLSAKVAAITTNGALTGESRDRDQSGAARSGQKARTYSNS